MREPAPPTAPRFYPWCDAYGKEHPDIPRCCASARGRGLNRKYHRQCDRKGVVQRGPHAGREGWYCLQHDPAKRDEERVERVAPILLQLLREALELMPRTKSAADWRRRAEAAIAKAEGRVTKTEDIP